MDRNHYHTQEYYPEWLPDELTFQGTRLPNNMWNLSEHVDAGWSPYYYVLVGFRYGYADNLPNFTDKSDATSYNYEGRGIDISWAVDEQRKPVNLDFIDFVRVYTGLNQKCPQPEWWGETSTEFAGAEDMHLEASLEAIYAATLGVKEVSSVPLGNTNCYDLQGRRIQLKGQTNITISKGLYIQDGKKFIIK
jgi:hypothetical protein